MNDQIEKLIDWTRVQLVAEAVDTLADRLEECAYNDGSFPALEEDADDARDAATTLAHIKRVLRSRLPEIIETAFAAGAAWNAGCDDTPLQDAAKRYARPTEGEKP